MYINLIWIWGHPEVYVLILPAFGVFSEVIATFSRGFPHGIGHVPTQMSIETLLEQCAQFGLSIGGRASRHVL
jgi:hypothetical protein